MAGQTTKPPVMDVIDFDRLLTDSCYMSNCGSVQWHAAPTRLCRNSDQRCLISPSCSRHMSRQRPAHRF